MERSDFLNLTETEAENLAALAGRHSLLTLTRQFDAWLKFQGEVASSPQPRWLLEAQVIRLAGLPALIPLTDLAARLERLLGQNPPPKASAPPPAPRPHPAPPEAPELPERPEEKAPPEKATPEKALPEKARNGRQPERVLDNGQLAALKAAPDLQELQALLPGEFIEFRPGAPEEVSEAPEGDEDEEAPNIDDD